VPPKSVVRNISLVGIRGNFGVGVRLENVVVNGQAVAGDASS